MLAYTANSYGQPRQTTLSITVTTPYGMTNQTYLKTNTSGLGVMHVPEPKGLQNSTVSVPIMDLTTGFGGGSSIQKSNIPITYVWGQFLTPVYSKNQSVISSLLFVFARSDMYAPTGYKLYYIFTDSIRANSTYEDSLHYLGTMSGYAAIIQTPPDFLTMMNRGVQILVYAPNGSLVFQTPTYHSGFFIPFSQSASTYTSVEIGWVQNFALTLPILAVYVSLISYGIPRLSGTLEPILAKPVTRRRLLLSRYLASETSITLALTLGVLLLNLVIYALTNSSFPDFLIVSTIVGSIVTSSAFIGLGILLSHLLKTQNMLIISALSLAASLGLLPMLVFPMTNYGFGVDSELDFNYVQMQVYSYIVNPSQFGSLILLLFQKSVDVGGTNGVLVPVSYFGLSMPIIILDGILWATVPLALALYLAGRRD
ncbi:MAG: ABC transporter permease subunit [Conexivisphaerales archaeon]